MDVRIGRLHNRYRVLGAATPAGALASRLDRLVRERVPELLAGILSGTGGGPLDDKAVYVLRRVRARVPLALAGGATDGRLAEQVAGPVAGAIVRAILNPPADGGDLIRFESQAEYVVQFIVDLMDGQAWDRWFYGAFARWRPRPVPAAAAGVLADNRDHLPAILAALQRRGALDRVLTLLAGKPAQSLWADGLAARSLADPDALYPLFAQAARLADRLGLWAPGHRDPDALFREYAASGPLAADWRDAAGLAAAVLDVLRFLAGRGALHGEMPAGERLDAALVGMDWLDAAAIRAGMPDIFGGPRAVQAPGELPVLQGGSAPTLRQQALLSDLAAVLEAGLRLDRDHPEAPANALRLYAALVGHAPRWAGDAMATAVIGGLLKAWAHLMLTGSPGEAAARLGRGDLRGAAVLAAEADRAAAEAAWRLPAAMGGPGRRVLSAMVEGVAGGGRPVPTAAPRGPASGAGTVVETECAGVFLLARAVLDARLAALAVQSGCPPRGLDGDASGDSSALAALRAWLVALGLRWAGPGGLFRGEPDPGLRLLAGLADPPRAEELWRAWSPASPADLDRFQAALLRLLAGQRLLGGRRLYLYRVPLDGGPDALVAGDEAGGLWPLGRSLNETDDPAEIVGRWLEAWAGGAGRVPSAVVAPADLLDAAGLREALADVEAVAIPTGAEPAGATPEGNAYQRNRAALAALLAALDSGRLGLPGADLAVALAAAALLRVWARWLRRFAASSVPYLLDNLIRRPGRVTVDDRGLLVELAPAPLDIVIEMAGYLDEIERVPWLDQGGVRFAVRGR